jgi:hypothetical protein
MQNKNKKHNKNRNQKSKKKIFHLGLGRSGGLIITNALEIAEKKIAFHNIITAKYCYLQFLGIVMYNNLVEKGEILQKDLYHYDGYFNLSFSFPDREFHFADYFEEIEKRHQGSQFVMTVRPIMEWILSKIFLSKRSHFLFHKEITDKKIMDWIEYYFQHCAKVRDYFQKPEIKKRSKLYVFIPNQISPEELLKQMDIYLYPNVKMDLKDFNEFQFDKEDYKKYIKDTMIISIQEKLKNYGNPAELTWWSL